MTYSLNTMKKLIANGTPISQAMKQVYKTRTVAIPFNDGDFDISVPELGLSNRSTNTLMRNNLKTLQEVVDCLDKNGWGSIKAFGMKSALEVFEKILDVAWEHMNSKERTEFLMQIDIKNEAII